LKRMPVCQSGEETDFDGYGNVAPVGPSPGSPTGEWRVKRPSSCEVACKVPVPGHGVWTSRTPGGPAGGPAGGPGGTLRGMRCQGGTRPCSRALRVRCKGSVVRPRVCVSGTLGYGHGGTVAGSHREATGVRVPSPLMDRRVRCARASDDVLAVGVGTNPPTPGGPGGGAKLGAQVP
jgi:hypothetical protein